MWLHSVSDSANDQHSSRFSIGPHCADPRTGPPAAVGVQPGAWVASLERGAEQPSGSRWR
jgi:hypothetical protein